MITVAREFGAGGETIGQALAQRLGIDFLDKALITQVAVRLELQEQEVEPHDERPGSLLHRLLTALGSAPIEIAGPPEVTAWAPPYADPAFDPRRAVLRLTQEAIEEAARTQKAVIVGRGAAYVLADLPDALHVFLRAAVKIRLSHVRDAFGLPEAEALRLLTRTDANRAAYVRQVYGHDWAHPSHYHMVLDTGRLGHEASVAAILAAVP